MIDLYQVAQVTSAYRGQNANTDPADCAAARGCSGLHRLIELKKGRTRLLQESDASIRDSYTSMVSFKERYPELILQFSHATTDRRLPDTQDGRNTTKTQVLADEERLTDGDQCKSRGGHPLFAS